MKICILGCGALGSSIGGVLTESGLNVYLLDKWKAHVDVMNRQGLKIKEDASERFVAVRATTDCREIGPVDLLIVLVKSFHTRDAVKNAFPLIGDKTTVLSLQNGLGNEETIADIVGKERVLGGITYAGGVLIGPGEVIVGRKGKRIYIGELDGEITDRVDKVCKLFGRAGLETTVSDNIYDIIWYKLLVNIAVGPLSALSRLPHVEMSKVREIKECAAEAVSEAVTAANADGVELSVNDPREIWQRATENLPPEHKSSMLQDIEKGSRTEIDYINGAVVSLGEKYNISTPVNKALVAGVKGIEHQLKMSEQEIG